METFICTYDECEHKGKPQPIEEKACDKGFRCKDCNRKIALQYYHASKNKKKLRDFIERPKKGLQVPDRKYHLTLEKNLAKLSPETLDYNADEIDRVLAELG